MNDLTLHPLGTPKKRPESDCRALVPAEGPVVLDTFGGRIHVEWDPDGAITALGQLPFFTEYLKVSGLFEPWVEECPVQWRSPNAPNKRDVLGTAVLSVLCGHQRYAHISALRGDSINAPLLGMEKVVSEDSVRATFSKVEEAAGIAWLQRHLLAVSEPLLGEPWNEATVAAGVAALAKDFNPLSDHRAGREYRLRVAGNLLRKCYLETTRGESLRVVPPPVSWAERWAIHAGGDGEERASPGS